MENNTKPHRSAGSTNQNVQELQKKSDRDQSDMDDIGYVKIFVKPLKLRGCDWILDCLGLQDCNQWCVTGIGVSCFFLTVYILILADIGFLIHRLTGIILPLISIASVFYWLSVCLGRTWTSTNVYICFCSCVAGEFLAQLFIAPSNETSTFIQQPMMALSVLVPVGGAAMVTSLSGSHSGLLVAAVSIVRYIACTMLLDIPQCVRPFIAYISGITGVVGAKCMETKLKQPLNNVVTNDGKTAVIRRRRSSSSSNMHNSSFSLQRPGRRTSLPALIHKNQVSKNP